VHLPGVELATFVASDDVLGVNDRCGPVEAVSERASDDHSGGAWWPQAPAWMSYSSWCP
jgi:hypothetical protein